MVTKSLSLEVSSLQASQAIEEHPHILAHILDLPPWLPPTHAGQAGRQRRARAKLPFTLLPLSLGSRHARKLLDTK